MSFYKQNWTLHLLNVHIITYIRVYNVSRGVIIIYNLQMYASIVFIFIIHNIRFRTSYKINIVIIIPHDKYNILFLKINLNQKRQLKMNLSVCHKYQGRERTFFILQQIVRQQMCIRTQYHVMFIIFYQATYRNRDIYYNNILIYVSVL